MPNPDGRGVDSVIEAPKYNTVSEGNASYSNSTYSNFLLSSDFIIGWTGNFPGF
jgi:hypothetical protein